MHGTISPMLCTVVDRSTSPTSSPTAKHRTEPPLGKGLCFNFGGEDCVASLFFLLLCACAHTCAPCSFLGEFVIYLFLQYWEKLYSMLACFRAWMQAVTLISWLFDTFLWPSCMAGGHGELCKSSQWGAKCGPGVPTASHGPVLSQGWWSRVGPHQHGHPNGIFCLTPQWQHAPQSQGSVIGVKAA